MCAVVVVFPICDMKLVSLVEEIETEIFKRPVYTLRKSNVARFLKFREHYFHSGSLLFFFLNSQYRINSRGFAHEANAHLSSLTF